MIPYSNRNHSNLWSSDDDDCLSENSDNCKDNYIIKCSSNISSTTIKDIVHHVNMEHFSHDNDCNNTSCTSTSCTNTSCTNTSCTNTSCTNTSCTNTSCTNTSCTNNLDLRMKIINNHVYDECYKIEKITCDKKYINLFSKTLIHDKYGFVNLIEINKLIKALATENYNLLYSIKQCGRLKLASPEDAWNNIIIGKAYYPLVRPYKLFSCKIGCDMIRLYCLSLLRDVPFEECNCDNFMYKNIDKLCEKNILSCFRNLSTNNYISQFLLMQCSKVKVYKHDFNYHWRTMLNLQNGNYHDAKKSCEHYYINNGRQLSMIVEDENNLYKLFNILVYQMDDITSCSENINNVLYLLGIVYFNVYTILWYYKWNYLYLRPEEYSIEVERYRKTHHNKYNISKTILESDVLKYIYNKQKSYLLSTTTPEGCNTCPSYPSFTAALAAACSIVYKFYFKTNKKIRLNKVCDNKLVCTDEYSTIECEINKLVYNIGEANCWGGFNYPFAVEIGYRLGEDIAISILKDTIYSYHDYKQVIITRLDGEKICIKN